MFARLARFRRFSLATMLLIVTLLSLYLGWEWRKVEERRAVLAWMAARDVRSEGRSLCEITLDEHKSQSWLARWIERESSLRSSTPSSSGQVQPVIIYGAMPDEMARLRKAFPHAQIREWAADPNLARSINWRESLTAEEARKARARAAHDLWSALQLANWATTDPTADYISVHMASCVLRDTDLAQADNCEERIAARREHMERMRHHYLQRYALYQVGAAGGDAHLEAEAHLGWLEAELELRAEEGRTDSPAASNIQSKTLPEKATAAINEVARNEKMTVHELQLESSRVAERLWVALHTNSGGPPPYGDRDFYFGYCRLLDTELALAANPPDRAAARRRHLERLQRRYDRCRELYDVGALGGEPHVEARLRLQCLKAICELNDEEAREDG